MRPALSALREALTFFLPVGIQPDDLEIHGTGKLPRRVVVHGPETSPGDRRFSFTAVPTNAHRPRALLPSQPSRGSLMLQPRSTSGSAADRLASRVIERLPDHVWRLVGTEVVLALPTYSAGADIFTAEFANCQLGCYLGNSENRGRVSVQAFDARGVRAVAKFVCDDAARTRLANETHVLETLATDPRLRSLVPRVIAKPSSHLGACIITDAFTGNSCPLRITPPLADWLRRCSDTNMRVSPLDTSLIGDLEDRAIAAGLASEYTRACEALAQVDVPSTIVHGDFAPWNIRIHGTEARVFDWEYGRLGGVPGWDELYFATQVAVITQNAQAANVIRIGRQRISRGHPSYTAQALVGLMTMVWIELAARYVEQGDERRAAVMCEALRLPLRA